MAKKKYRYFTSPKKMQTKVDEYFDSTDTYTITGLTYFLGFATRKSLSDYDKKESFKEIVQRAKLRVAKYYEEQLVKGKVAGSIFALKNIDGWTDRQELAVSGDGIQIEIVNFRKDIKDKDNDKEDNDKEESS